MTWNRDALKLMQETISEDSESLYGFKLLVEWFTEINDAKRAAAALFRVKNMPEFRSGIIPNVLWFDEGEDRTYISINQLKKEDDMALDELLNIDDITY